MGAVRMMRTSSLSMRTFRPIAVGILGSEFEQRRLVAELYLLPGLVHMHDLVDELEQRLVVVNLAVMHFLWLCPRFFGIFRSSCFVSIRYNPHRRWQTNEVEAELALKPGRAFIAHFVEREA
jgi:hypothetical protein